MNTIKEQYKKLYVLSPQYYDKLQKQRVKVTPDQPLDQLLLNIMQNKQPNVYKKWLMYKNALIKFRESKDKNTLKIPQVKEPEIDKNITFKTPHFKKLLKTTPSYHWDFENIIETPVTSKPRKSVTFPKNLNNSQSDLFNKYRKQNDDGFLNSTQEDEDDSNEILNIFDQTPEQIFDSTRNPELKEIFEHNLNNSSDKTKNEEIEQELFNIAQRSLGEQNEQNIVRLDNTLDDDFRAFENRKTRDLIAIEVEPVQNFVENGMQPNLRREEAPRSNVSPIIINVDEYTANEYQPKYIRMSENPLTPTTTTTSKTSSDKRRSIHLRNRRIEGRRSSSMSRIQYKRKSPSKKTKNIQQPQSGKGFDFKWQSFNQKRI